MPRPLRGEGRANIVHFLVATHPITETAHTCRAYDFFEARVITYGD